MFSRQATKRFSRRVDPGESGTLTTQIDEPATVEGLTIRFYQGPELNLELVPFRKRESDRLPLVDLVGRDVIVGDADVFNLSVSEQIHDGDVVGVQFENTSTEHAYDFQVDVTLEHAGGIDRALSSLTGVL